MIYALNTTRRCIEFMKDFNISELSKLPKIKEIDLNKLLDDLGYENSYALSFTDDR